MALCPERTSPRCSRLSKPTVSDQVDSLIARALVVEVGPGNAGIRGGKKAHASRIQPRLRPDPLRGHRARVDALCRC